MKKISFSILPLSNTQNPFGYETSVRHCRNLSKDAFGMAYL